MNMCTEDVETWADCFSAIGDPTRIVILNLLATAERPMSVGEIVDAVEVGQSTVSYHLRILASVNFVTVERVGTASLWQINERCLTCLPAAAEVVMGRSTRNTPWSNTRATSDGGRGRKAGRT